MLETGVIHEPARNQRVLEILTTLFRFGFFDHPTWPDNSAQDNVTADEAVADAAEEGGEVLLENRGHVLPLNRRTVRSIAVIGPAADQYIHGNGSSQVTPYLKTTALAGIEARAAQAGIPVSYQSGRDPARAETAARQASVALVVAADTESEGDDKPCMSLVPRCSGGQQTPPHPLSTQLAFGDQDRLISRIAAANPRTVVVLETGAPVLTPWRDQIAGLLEGWYPGEDGGTAIAHVLFGDVDPGGRLPATFPQRAADTPTAAGGAARYPGVINPAAGNCDLDVLSVPCPFFQENYGEGVMVGYRWYQHERIAPAFPFGYGLSYTSFRFDKLRIGRERNRGVIVSATVTNTGRRAGWAVPQVYVSLPSLPGVPQPPWQLAGFDKVLLGKGASRNFQVTLDARAFSYWSNGDGAWRVAPGCGTIALGSSSAQLVRRAHLSQDGVSCTSARRSSPPGA
jgi:beta-glucosidase